MRPWYQPLSLIAEELGCQPTSDSRKGGETPYKTVATSVYKLGTETVQIESWEVWTYQLSSLACNILQIEAQYPLRGS